MIFRGCTLLSDGRHPAPRFAKKAPHAPSVFRRGKGLAYFRRLDLMIEQELAAELKICRRQLYNWRMAGLIPYFKLGKAAA